MKACEEVRVNCKIFKGGIGVGVQEGVVRAGKNTNDCCRDTQEYINVNVYCKKGMHAGRVINTAGIYNTYMGEKRGKLDKH